MFSERIDKWYHYGRNRPHGYSRSGGTCYQSTAVSGAAVACHSYTYNKMKFFSTTALHWKNLNVCRISAHQSASKRYNGMRSCNWRKGQALPSTTC